MFSRIILLISLLCLRAHAVVEGEADNFAPEVNGAVRAMLADTDGSVVIAGDFTEVNGAPRGGLARLRQDGTLDASFATGTGADGPIHCIVATSGGYYIGGDFLNFDGQARGRIARLTATGALNTSFVPGEGANATVRCLRSTTSSTATVWAGGDFTTMRGVGVGYFAVLTGSGTFAPEFGTDSSISSLHKANGKVLAFAEGRQGIFVAGEFTNWGGASAGRLVRLSSSLSIRKAGAFNGPVTALLASSTSSGFSSDGVVCFGSFTQYAGQIRNGFAQITLSSQSSDPPMVLRDTQNTVNGGSVRCVVRTVMNTPFGFNQVWVGGDFTGVNGYPASGVATLEEATPVSSFDGYDLLAPRYASNLPITPTPGVFAMARGPGDRIYIGGSFASIGSKSRSNIARLYGPSLNTLPSNVTSVNVSSIDGSQVALTWNSASAATSYLVQRRLTAESTWTDLFETTRRWALDPTASPATSYTYRVLSKNMAGTATQGNFKTIVTESGPWTGSGGIPEGQNLPAFPANSVKDFAFYKDGRTLVAGNFPSTPEGVTSDLTRLLPDGVPDPSFEPAAGIDAVGAVKLLPDGKLLVGGAFTSVAGLQRRYLVRLNANGSLDPSFESPYPADLNLEVRDLALFPDGRIAVLHGNRLSVLLPDGDEDPGVDTNVAFDSFSNSFPRLAVLPEGRLLISGLATSRDGSIGNIMILKRDGSIDYECQGRIGALEFLPTSADCDATGRIYAAGLYPNGLGGYRSVARFLPDGRVDTSFTGPTLRTSSSLSIAPSDIRVMLDGKVLVYGPFQATSDLMNVMPGIARLMPDGAFDPGFRAIQVAPIRFGSAIWNPPSELEIDELNRIWIGNMGETIATIPVPGLICLDTLAVVSESPASVEGEPGRSGGIRLSWVNSPEAFGTRIEGRIAGAAEWQLLAELPQPISSWHHQGAAPGQEWEYRLTHWNKLGLAAAASVPPVSTYRPAQLWAAAQGVEDLSNLESDSDGDGMPWLLEYAFGGSATGPNDPQPQSWIMFEQLYLIFPSPRADLNYEVEKSHGDGWTTTGVFQGPTGSTRLAWVPIAGHARTFLRVKVTPK